jgi:hypothetical protein
MVVTENKRATNGSYKDTGAMCMGVYHGRWKRELKAASSAHPLRRDDAGVKRKCVRGEIYSTWRRDVMYKVGGDGAISRCAAA